jgi:protein gp37
VQTQASNGLTARFNPWWGCVKVSEACRHCYAATLANRYGTEWGPQARRRFFGEKHWQEPLKWNRKAEAEGRRWRVFCASMADVFEALPQGHPDEDAMEEARHRVAALVTETPWLDWLLLTKRPENALLMLPEWRDGWPSNAWAGATVEDQAQAWKRVPYLLRIPARVHFLSCEPLLGPVNLRALSGCTKEDCWNGCMPSGISWVIAGGESGPGARPSHPDWFRSLRDQCGAARVPFHFKQWGDWIPNSHTSRRHPWHAQQIPDGWRVDAPLNAPWGTHAGPADGWFPNTTPWNGHDDDGEGEAVMVRLGKKAAGRRLDGFEWNGVPAVA